MNVAAKGKNVDIPAQASWKLTDGAKFVHICSNETIQGVEFKEDPDLKGKVLVADMSSNILSKPVDVAKYGVIYAGAQKASESANGSASAGMIFAHHLAAASLGQGRTGCRVA